MYTLSETEPSLIALTSTTAPLLNVFRSAQCIRTCRSGHCTSSPSTLSQDVSQQSSQRDTAGTATRPSIFSQCLSNTQAECFLVENAGHVVGGSVGGGTCNVGV